LQADEEGVYSTPNNISFVICVRNDCAKCKYRHEITRQYMLASGAFIIENPDKAGDANAMNLPAVESTLKVYSAILQRKPDAKWKPFDDLLKRQSQGKLDQSLRKQCK
jgi:hypothetical protein